MQLGSGRATPPHASISIDERGFEAEDWRDWQLGKPMWGPHAPGEWAACTVEPREISRTSEVLQGFAFPHRRDFNVGEPPCCRSGTSGPGHLGGLGSRRVFNLTRPRSNPPGRLCYQFDCHRLRLSSERAMHDCLVTVFCAGQLTVGAGRSVGRVQCRCYL